MITINPSEARWSELKLYFLITDCLLQRQNFTDVVSLINACNIFSSFSTEEAVELCKHILTLPRFRPTKEEFIFVSKINNMPRAWILWKGRVGATRYKNTIKRYKKDPLLLRSQLTPEQLELCNCILAGHNILRRVGAPDVSSRKNVGTVQKPRYGIASYESLRLS